MKFGITKRTIGSYPIIEISEEQFNTYKFANQKILEALFIEEKFNFVIDNYYEFEKELLEKILNRALFPTIDYVAFTSGLFTINRRVLNLLASSRLYIDQLKHNVKQIDSEYKTKIDTKVSQEYDENLNYRFIEAIRNYIQHRDLPITLLSYPSKRLDEKNGYKIEHQINCMIDIDILKDDEKIKKSVLNEIAQNSGATVNIIPVIRSYMQSLGKIHIYTRELIKEEINNGEKLILDTIEEYKQLNNNDALALGVINFNEDESFGESHPVFDDAIRKKRILIDKNYFITNFEKYIITNKFDDE